jgi:DNA-binding transcriptional MocR family regulator
VIQHNLSEVLNYDELAGRRELREQIARLMLDGGSVVTADDLVITSGCHSALSLALLSVCQPGDIVAVESPSYYGTMQLLRGLGIKAIEIPTDPDSGISIEAWSWRWSSGRSKALSWCRTAITRRALSCRTPASARC